MPELLSFLAAVLLAAPAGLNPYLPLLIVAVMARFASLPLLPPYGFLGTTGAVLLAGALFLAHTFLDKAFLPGDSLAAWMTRHDRKTWVGVSYDLGHMLLSPLAAALLMGATTWLFPPSWPLVAPMVGALLATLVYVGKRAWRHRWKNRLGPFTNMLLSVIEDVVAVLICLAGLLVRPAVPS